MKNIVVWIGMAALVGCGYGNVPQPSTGAPATSSVETAAPTPGSTTVIQMTSKGFAPNQLVVKAGTTVEFLNIDSVPRWPASAMHPTHLELPGFDSLKGIPTGSSYSYTFTKVGTWRFHDHLYPSMFGAVTVE